MNHKPYRIALLCIFILIVSYISLCLYKALHSDGWNQRAEEGDAIAQHCLGAEYWHGYEGISQNTQKAEFWLKEAALQGYYPAIRDLVQFYQEVLGIHHQNTVYWNKKEKETAILLRFIEDGYASLRKNDQKGAMEIFQKAHIMAKQIGNKFYDDDVDKMIEGIRTGKITRKNVVLSE